MASRTSFNPFIHTVSALALGALAFSSVASAQGISGAGSSAAAPIYKAWGEMYSQATGHTVSYDPVGSGEGTKRIKARAVDFGASDVAMSPAEAKQHGLIIVPTVVTAAVPVLNVPGLATGQLKLTGEVLAKIFMAQITLWNAAEIRALNPSAKLPNLPIQVVVRADGSGTTYHFTDYLSKVSSDWQTQRGVKNKFDWPATFLAVKGSSEVAKTVAATNGAIGYVDFNYVREYKLNYAQVKNAAGNFVSPSLENFREAVANSDWLSKGNFISSLTNLKGLKSWPITMGTFIAIPQTVAQGAKGLEVLRFITWGYLHGDQLAKTALFVPLPDLVQARAYGELGKLTDHQGKLIGLYALANPETRLIKTTQADSTNAAGQFKTN